MSTQAEQLLENNLVSQLVEQGYEKVAVLDEPSLLANLKAQLEEFNSLSLTAGEFNQVMNHLTRSSSVFEKAKDPDDTHRSHNADQALPIHLKEDYQIIHHSITFLN